MAEIKNIPILQLTPLPVVNLKTMNGIVIGYRYNYVSYKKDSDRLWVQFMPDKINVYALSKYDHTRFQCEDGHYFGNGYNAFENSAYHKSHEITPDKYYTDLVFTTPYKSFIKRTGTSYDNDCGDYNIFRINKSVLIQLDNEYTYIHIGLTITKFSTDSEIKAFITPKFRSNWHVEALALTETKLYIIENGICFNIIDIIDSPLIDAKLKHSYQNNKIYNINTGLCDFDNYAHFKEFADIMADEPLVDRYLETIECVAEYTPYACDDIPHVNFDTEELFDINKYYKK